MCGVAEVVDVLSETVVVVFSGTTVVVGTPMVTLD